MRIELKPFLSPFLASCGFAAVMAPIQVKVIALAFFHLVTRKANSKEIDFYCSRVTRGAALGTVLSGAMAGYQTGSFAEGIEVLANKRGTETNMALEIFWGLRPALAILGLCAEYRCGYREFPRAGDSLLAKKALLYYMRPIANQALFNVWIILSTTFLQTAVGTAFGTGLRGSAAAISNWATGIGFAILVLQFERLRGWPVCKRLPFNITEVVTIYSSASLLGWGIGAIQRRLF